MNPGSKREVKIDGISLAILLVAAHLLYENFDVPHGRTGRLFLGAICLVLISRLIWLCWAALAEAANITFKDASAFGWWRRQVIRFDIVGMREYFAGLGIPVPGQVPPVTVREGGQAIYSPPAVHRGELQIPRLEVTNRKVVTHIYAVYVMNMAFPDPSKTQEFWASLPHSMHQLNLIQFFSADLRRYFHASYWNSIGDEAGTATLVLWRIREDLGRKFADKLAGQVYRVAVDSLSEIADSDFNVSLRKALKLADALVESYQQKWQQIQKILKDNPVDVKFRTSYGNVDPREFSPY